MGNSASNAVMIETAIDMLLTGCDLYVNKNDFTPNKINAKMSKGFSKSDYILDQYVDLCWESRKGYRVGVVFFGMGRDVSLRNSFVEDKNTFIAKFDLSGLNLVLEQAGKSGSIKSIRDILVKQNSFASWLFWPHYPLTRSKPNHDDNVFLAYEAWLQQSEPFHSSVDYQVASDHSSGIRATYRGCKRSKTTDELIYSFRVDVGGKPELYHLVCYDKELYLLNYIYESVPINWGFHIEILNACKAKMPIDTLVRIIT